ncbi:MAG: hypothetical protein ABI184_04475 [Ginsengibacter sp.]
MKKILFALLAGLIPALAVINETYAQSGNDIASLTPVKNYFDMENKKGVTENSNTVILVNAKALKIFNKQYKVNDEKWMKSGDCITASYKLDNISHCIYFDKKGHWVGSVKIYDEAKMPKDIRKMVRREYYDYKIGAVYEVEAGSTTQDPTYIVNIEDSTNFKQIRINDNGMDVYKEFQKP